MAEIRLSLGSSGKDEAYAVIDVDRPLPDNPHHFHPLRWEVSRSNPGYTNHILVRFQDGSFMRINQAEMTVREIDVTGDGKDAWEMEEEAKQGAGSAPGRVTLPSWRQKQVRNDDKTIVEELAIREREIQQSVRLIKGQRYRQHIVQPERMGAVNGGQQPIIEYDPANPDRGFRWANCTVGMGQTAKPLAPIETVLDVEG